MSNILSKKCCSAILLGTALSVNIIDIRLARASFIDNVINRCIEKSNSVGLTPQEAQYCNQARQLMIQRDNRNNSLKIYQQSLQNQVDIAEQMTNPIIIRPTNFGVGIDNN